jgi:dTDP-glucose 4,6-dehydratase
MRLLVTGGAGFIGSHYAEGLLDGRYPGSGDDHVTVLDKLTYAGRLVNLPATHPRLTSVVGDVCDSGLLSDLLPGCDAVVHFAAESHVDRSIDSSAAFMRTNVVGTQRLLDGCVRARVPRFVHISTDEVYGSIDRGSWSEEDLLEPNSPYAASKAASDLVARAYWRTHDISVSISRSCNNYGPRQHPEKIIPLFVTNLLNGRDVPIYGDGQNIREWLHVEDHCRAIDLVLRNGRPGEIYNIGDGTALTNRDLTDRLLRQCGAGWGRVRGMPDRKAHDRRYSVATRKIREQLGFSPQIPFEQGLTNVVQWYRDNRWWWEPLCPRQNHEQPAMAADGPR